MRRVKETASEPDPDERSWVYRVILGAMMFPMLLLFGTGFYYRFKDNWQLDPESKTPVFDRIVEIIGTEIHVAFFIASLLGVIWAIAAPEWLYGALDKSFDKALKCILWMILVSIIYGRVS